MSEHFNKAVSQFGQVASSYEIKPIRATSRRPTTIKLFTSPEQLRAEGDDLPFNSSSQAREEMHGIHTASSSGYSFADPMDQPDHPMVDTYRASE